MSVKCPHCQKEFANAPNFCDACGAKIEKPAPPPNPQYQGQQMPPPYGYQQPPQYSQPTVDSNSKVLAALFYFYPILFFVALLQHPKDDFVLFHANQNLLRLLMGAVSVVVFIIPILGWLVTAIIGIFNFICFILGLIAVYNGQYYQLPIIGKYTFIR